MDRSRRACKSDNTGKGIITLKKKIEDKVVKEAKVRIAVFAKQFDNIVAALETTPLTRAQYTEIENELCGAVLSMKDEVEQL